MKGLGLRLRVKGLRFETLNPIRNNILSFILVGKSFRSAGLATRALSASGQGVSLRKTRGEPTPAGFLSLGDLSIVRVGWVFRLTAKTVVLLELECSDRQSTLIVTPAFTMGVGFT